jgi:hypothetical protein
VPGTDVVTTARLQVRVPREADRLAPECRGLGYATEASQALGLTFWKQAPVDGDLRNLYTLAVREL